VLGRAYEVFGGVPVIAVEAVNDEVEEDTKKRLRDMTSMPA
jgi:hypothetical protein